MASLKEARENKGLKQKWIAEQLGIAPETYCRYEQNPNMLRIEQARTICEILGCSLDEIFLQSDVN